MASAGPAPGPAPSSIIIVGSGVFGLSTAYALALDPFYADTRISVIDRSPFPPPDGSSFDTSRIVRADYADLSYAELALDAQHQWRHSWWGSQGAYHEDGLVICGKRATDGVTRPHQGHGRDQDQDADGDVPNLTGAEYMRRSLENVRRLGLKEPTDLQVFPGVEAIRALVVDASVDGSSTPENDTRDFDAHSAYINHRSGWVDAGHAMRLLRDKLFALDRVTFLTGRVIRLCFSPSSSVSTSTTRPRVTGVLLADGTRLSAALTLLATGAWTPALVDLRGIASATGQVLGYISLTPAEQTAVAHNPTLLNESTGLFIISPSGGELKVARHGYGYANPVQLDRHPEPLREDAAEDFVVSLPWTNGAHDQPQQRSQTDEFRDVHCDQREQQKEHQQQEEQQQQQRDQQQEHQQEQQDPDHRRARESQWSERGIPAEADRALRAYLRCTYPSLAARPWARTRICWYTDTPVGDWLVDHHPRYDGLFVATGGSGHAFKFAPVVGDCIVKRLKGEPVGHGLDRKWDWPVQTSSRDRKKDDECLEGHVFTEDWRGGRKGMILAQEFDS